jgi:hypothetical protein
MDIDIKGLKLKTIKALIKTVLGVGVALHMGVAAAQPPLSKLPQANPPEIAEATKQIIRGQLTANVAAGATTTSVERQAIVTQSAPSTTTLSAAKSDNQVNQNAYIADVKRRLTEH